MASLAPPAQSSQPRTSAQGKMGALYDWTVTTAQVPQARAVTHIIGHSKSWDSDLSQRSCKKGRQCLSGRDRRDGVSDRHRKFLPLRSQGAKIGTESSHPAWGVGGGGHTSRSILLCHGSPWHPMHQPLHTIQTPPSRTGGWKQSMQPPLDALRTMVCIPHVTLDTWVRGWPGRGG